MSTSQLENRMEKTVLKKKKMLKVKRLLVLQTKNRAADYLFKAVN